VTASGPAGAAFEATPAGAPFPAGGLDDARGRVYTLRHGATAWSLGGRHTSRTDVPLTADGERAAAALRPLLARLLGGAPPALALTSPLRRAAHTAELAGVVAEPVDELREVDYGGYEGLTTPEIRESVPGWTVWTHPTPGGETLAEVGKRVDRVLERVRDTLGQVPGGDVVLVAHGHLLRVLTARWLGLEPDAGRFLALDTATLSALGYERETPVVWHWNIPNPDGG
jgi:probable phosphoglycerate mutase